MSDLGYAYFTESKVYGSTPVLDGVPLGHLPFPVEAVPSSGVHVLEHADGGRTLQLDYRDDTDPEGLDDWEFRFEVLAREEAAWWAIDKLYAKRDPFYFIPWRQETAVFIAGRSLDAFVLQRPDALSELPDHADIGEYETLAWLDGVEQEVIASGTPGAGEVKVVGRNVTTPTLTAGQELVIRYCPAYRVAILSIGPERVSEFNLLTRQLVLTEVREPA